MQFDASYAGFRLRDPSHTYCLKKSRLLALFEQNGLDVTVAETVAVDVNVNRWLALTQTNEETCTVIKDNLIADINSTTNRTGMFPFMDHGELMFKQTWVKVIGRKGERRTVQ